MPDDPQAPAAFISYSREDSEFALRLAQDLKAAGASVWIDQLDIAAGQLWDNAIEGALVTAPIMVVVLSPHSAGNNNVLNEISFALERGATVIPAIYRDCVVPLQIHRANRIDFRADYTRGLNFLLSSLQVAHPDPAVLHDAAEAEAKRKAAWEAREAEARRLQELADSKPLPPTRPRPAQAAPPPAAYVPPLPPQPAPIRRPWFQLTIGKFAIAGGLAAALIVGVIVLQGPSTGQGTAAAPPIVESPSIAPEIKKAPAGQDADIYGTVPACVFDPVSNVRVEPKAASAIACSIDTVRDIQVHSVPVEAASGLWWQTEACGKKGYIADNQVHVNTQCTP